MTEHNDYGLIDGSKFKCSTCKKSLSIFPIYTFIDQIENKVKNTCGRCSIQSHAARNIEYETLLKQCWFLCSVSNECGQKLSLVNVANHESICRFQEIKCPVCSLVCTVNNNIIEHFKKNHRDDLFIEQIPALLIDTIFIELQLFKLVQKDNKCFLISIYCHSHRIEIDVKAFYVPPEEYRFEVIIGNDSNCLCFKNNEINNFGKMFQFDWCFHGFFKYFFDDDTSNITLKINFFSTNESQTKIAGISNLNHIFLSVLQCPVCKDTMKNNISFCEKGHSFCSTCKNLVSVCPLCRCNFSDGRNFALEELAEIFSKTVKLK